MNKHEWISTAPGADAEVEEKIGQGLVVPEKVLPTTLLLVPVAERPFFPPQALPVVMGEARWLETVKQVGETAHHMVGLCLIKIADTDSATAEDFYEVGCAARMHNPVRSEDKLQFIAEGVQRFRVVKWISRDEPPYVAQVDYPPTTGKSDSDEIRAYAMALINTIKELLSLNPLYGEELKAYLQRYSPHDPSPLADFAAALTTASAADLQDVLATFPLRRRMEKVLLLLKKELEVAKLETHIRQQVEEKITEQQRRFFLREQLKAIQKELGLAKDDRTADLDRFRERLDTLAVPDDARGRIDDEMQKLAMLETGSPEYGVTRNYLDWITALPWGRYSEDKLDLEQARKVLDSAHDGLDDVKDRIVEFLAVGALRGEVAGSIMLLVGPPGVGKTSIGHSVAEALGRKFYRFSLGGMRDEAEIKGHRRTYIGAMPCKFIQALRECGVANPVVMLDEIDKVGASYHGDPASALLEVLDPEQNAAFLDHYLDIRFDLSKVLFICTANQLDTVPGPLLDRMEIIRLAGYITEEKLQIARHHLWPKQLTKAGLARRQLQITDGALRAVIEGYAREAGVRNLEKHLGRIVRKAVVKLLKGEPTPIRVGREDLAAYLGQAPFRPEKPRTGVGIITGLAWTPLGGATLAVEATRVHTLQRGFKLTGMLGEVMRESADIAHSYISSHLRDFRGDPEYFDKGFFHVHVPEGATRKDGPSAGVTIATALLSLARGAKPKRALTMTGELTLTGEVLAVGGIREKVIAARRSRIMELVLPEANRRDFDELPDYIRRGMTARFVEHYRELVPIVFGD